MYSDWVANIVPIPKRVGKVKMCVDYQDLNRPIPKIISTSLTCIDTPVDNTSIDVVFSFIDGFLGYNKIKMAEKDKTSTREYNNMVLLSLT